MPFLAAAVWDKPRSARPGDLGKEADVYGQFHLVTSAATGFIEPLLRADFAGAVFKFLTQSPQP